jgi:hypothetical protein
VSGRDGEAFSIPAGEGSEADCSEGRSKSQKGKREREGREPGAGLDRLDSGRPGWPDRASTPTSESDHRRGKFGSRKGRIRATSPAGRWDQERRPCETDDVTRAEFTRLGGSLVMEEGR